MGVFLERSALSQGPTLCCNIAPGASPMLQTFQKYILKGRTALNLNFLQQTSEPLALRQLCHWPSNWCAWSGALADSPNLNHCKRSSFSFRGPCSHSALLTLRRLRRPIASCMRHGILCALQIYVQLCPQGVDCNLIDASLSRCVRSWSCAELHGLATPPDTGKDAKTFPAIEDSDEDFHDDDLPRVLSWSEDGCRACHSIRTICITCSEV